MAAKKKTKVSDKASGVDVCCSPSMYVDFDDVAEVKGVSVGDTICLMVKGKVRSVEQRKAYEGEGTRASIQLEDFDAEIVPETSEFDALIDDDDD